MTTGYQKILLAIDGTDEADQVLRAGTELAPRQLDRFHVISVIPPVAAGAGASPVCVGSDGATSGKYL